MRANASILLEVWGPRALFARPEMKVERVSYDVITPSAARGVLDAIHWKPQMVWQIRRLTVLNRIQFESIRRNEVGSKIQARRVASAMRAGRPKGWFCMSTATGSSARRSASATPPSATASMRRRQPHRRRCFPL